MRHTVLVMLRASYTKTLSQLLVSRFDCVARERENQWLINICQAKHQTLVAVTDYPEAFTYSPIWMDFLGWLTQAFRQSKPLLSFSLLFQQKQIPMQSLEFPLPPIALSSTLVEPT
jgi:hypothetical protein